jgi:hypothetical protein
MHASSCTSSCTYWYYRCRLEYHTCPQRMRSVREASTKPRSRYFGPAGRGSLCQACSKLYKKAKAAEEKEEEEEEEEEDLGLLPPL